MDARHKEDAFDHEKNGWPKRSIGMQEISRTAPKVVHNEKSSDNELISSPVKKERRIIADGELTFWPSFFEALGSPRLSRPSRLIITFPVIDHVLVSISKPFGRVILVLHCADLVRNGQI